MANFSMVDDPSGDDQLSELYDDICAAGLGDTAPINWFRVMGSRPDLLQASWALVNGILVQGQLPGSLKQMIATVVSQQNGCRYCTVTHTGAMVGLGVAEELVQSCTSDPELTDVPDPQRAILLFALKAAGQPSEVTASDIDALREHGLSEGEIVEVGMMASLCNFINTWAEISGIQVDGEP